MRPAPSPSGMRPPREVAVALNIGAVRGRRLLPSRQGSRGCKMSNSHYMPGAEGQSFQSITCLSTPPAAPPQGYVDQQLVGSGHVTKGAIIGLDGSQWAISPGFNVIAYPLSIPTPQRSRQQGQTRGRRRPLNPAG
jgi:hypothetical protein